MINLDLLSISNTFWPGMANHLFQSTLFAAAACLFALFLKRNRARVRYWIWFSVSVKFLVPFSLVVGLGGLITPEWMKAPAGILTEMDVIQAINHSFTPMDPGTDSSAPDVAASQSGPDKAAFIVFSLWLCGSVAVLFNWHRQGARMTGMLRKAEELTDDRLVADFQRIKRENKIPDTVRLASTRDMMEPGVCGIFRSVIMLPTGILNHINDSELEAILLHEFAHVRCKDNLIAFIHMFVEAMFWFHPVVWWTGSRLVSERERACDESVLRSGKNPRVYAEGILKVCDFYFKSPLACVSGVIGSNLKNRLEGIMNKQVGSKMSLVQKAALSLSGILVLCIPLSIGMITAPPGEAHPSGDNLMEYKADVYVPDSFEAPFKPETGGVSSEAVNDNTDRNNTSALMAGSLLPADQTPEPDAATSPAITPEPSPHSIRASSDESPTPKENSSLMQLAGYNSGAQPRAEDAADDRNQDVAHLQEPLAVPMKYGLDNELEAVDRISVFRIKSYENIDEQSLVLRTNWSDYYLLVLQRPRFEISFGRTGVAYTGSAIIAGHDRVVMNYETGSQYYPIDKIYKLKGRKQVTEIKERLRKKQGA